jgi:inner membrane protein
VPSIFSHAIFATVVGKACVFKPLPLQFWTLTAICAILPDADAIAFVVGIPYNHMLGHRGITHSIAFTLLVGVIVGGFVFRAPANEFGRWALILYFALVTLSHPLLDALTNGGRGVALFAPFSNGRYFFPWRPIEVSPIGLGFFSEEGIEVLISEMVWIWLPAGLFLLVSLAYRKMRRTNAST